MSWGKHQKRTEGEADKRHKEKKVLLGEGKEQQERKREKLDEVNRKKKGSKQSAQ